VNDPCNIYIYIYIRIMMMMEIIMIVIIIISDIIKKSRYRVNII